MKRFLLTTMALSLSMHFSHAAEVSQPLKALKAGVHTHLHDTSVRPQDDFFRYSQGLWLKNEVIPADKSDWGTFMKAREDVQVQLKHWY